MGEWFASLGTRLKEAWSGPARGRLIGGSLLGLLTIGLFGWIFWWAAQPDWAPLYSGLDEVEAARVVGILEQQQVPFRLTAGGSSIEVPRPELYRLRVKLAAEGGPKPTIPGYELLDEPRMGMSDRELEMNQKRALEGELARTLSGLEWVHGATVHLTQPKPSLFEDEDLPATASVTLVTDPSRSIPKREVDGVVALVAASVEGLHPSRVTVVDSRGKLLTEPIEEDELFGRSNRQIELTRKMDAYFSRNAQEMMDRVLGEGRSVVRVNTSLDFSYLERTSRMFDPEQKIVRSQERDEESSTATDTTASQQERSIVNYEVNEILEHSRGQQGAIKRLSISLVVDGTYAEIENEEGDRVTNYLPRSTAEMSQFEELVKTAVGFDSQRGDQIQAHNIAFDTSEREDTGRDMRNQRLQEIAIDFLRKALFVGGIIAFLFLLRNTLGMVNIRISQAFEDKRALMLAAAKGESIEEIEEELPLAMELEAARTPEQRQLLKVHRKVSEYCRDNPQEAAKILRAWLNEGRHG
jgi:flagellar M-ring protein FliF